ncbi:MAG: bifunctional oligoribonuclease/PAP phosphatase NrnA [Clostridiales bacterium]|nr:bifunctional oligoribonuclease/PAP phosphatase NrnA [Clostridiales bacterium]
MAIVKTSKSNRIERTFSKELLHALEKGKNVLIFTHVSPDGDTIGSAIGLQLALESLGKKVVVTCSDPIPQVLFYMEKAKEILPPEEIRPEDFDLAVAVDVSDELRLGRGEKLFFQIAQTVQIDHHGTNPGYAKWNYIDESASATAILMVDIIQKLHVPLNHEMATALYSGLVIDTGNFSFDNTTAEALEVGSLLVAQKVQVDHINRVLFREKTPEQILLLAKALGHITFLEKGKIAGLCLAKEEIEEISTKPEYTEGIVNYAIDVTGVKMCFFGKELDEGVKFSLRAIPPYDVSTIATKFGGGGHPLAAGCTIVAPLADAVGQMASAMVDEIQREQ